MKIIMKLVKRMKNICPYCDFMRPDCLCAISTRVANDNENVHVSRHSD